MNRMTGIAAFSGTSLDRALMALLIVVEEETDILLQNALVQHGKFVERKNLALRELIMIQRAQSGAQGGAESLAVLSRLRSALEQNGHMLRLHMRAVTDVSDIIVEAMREADSDGTYSRGKGRTGR